MLSIVAFRPLAGLPVPSYTKLLLYAVNHTMVLVVECFLFTVRRLLLNVSAFLRGSAEEANVLLQRISSFIALKVLPHKEL